MVVTLISVRDTDTSSAVRWKEANNVTALGVLGQRAVPKASENSRACVVESLEYVDDSPKGDCYVIGC